MRVLQATITFAYSDGRRLAYELEGGQIDYAVFEPVEFDPDQIEPPPMKRAHFTLVVSASGEDLEVRRV